MLRLLPSSEGCEQIPQKLPLFRRDFTEKILIHLVHLAIKGNLEIASASSECNSIHAPVSLMRLALNQSPML